MRYAKASVALGTCILLASAGVALATGQPGSSAGVSCTNSPNALLTPGNAGSAINPSGTNGSPFNQNVPKEYAGNFDNPTTTNGHASPNAVSQYDVACRNVSSQPP
jgi:hypothetical protein